MPFLYFGTTKDLKGKVVMKIGSRPTEDGLSSHVLSSLFSSLISAPQMAENNEEIPAAICSIPCEDPPLPTAADGGENPTKEEESDTDRQQPKRRKNCPTSLDEFEAIKQSSAKSGFSFTFDTNFVTTPESTPKFGSFNSAVAAPEIVRCHQIPATIERKAQEDEEEEEVDDDYGKPEVSEERRQVVGVLSSADGVELESTVD